MTLANCTWSRDTKREQDFPSHFVSSFKASHQLVTPKKSRSLQVTFPWVSANKPHHYSSTIHSWPPGRSPPPLVSAGQPPPPSAPPGFRSLSHSAVVGPLHAPRGGGQSTGIVGSSGKSQRRILFSPFRGPVFLVMDRWSYFFFPHGKSDQEDSPFFCSIESLQEYHRTRNGGKFTDC